VSASFGPPTMAPVGANPLMCLKDWIDYRPSNLDCVLTGEERSIADLPVASSFHDLVGWVTPEEHACDRNPVELWQHRLIQVLLSPPDDVCAQILRCDLVPALQHADGITERCHHVQQNHLRMTVAANHAA
jgi:hypothetical protein